MPERGLRRIEATEAGVVQRIFREYVGRAFGQGHRPGLEPGSIVGPQGGAWGPSTIAGNAARGTGVLKNELYLGRLVWNRLRYVKDPATGKRVSRLNDVSSG